MDKHLETTHPGFNQQSMPTFCAGYSVSFIFIDRITLSGDYLVNFGTRSIELKKREVSQYKRLIANTFSLNLGYRLGLGKEKKYYLALKSGLGSDLTNYFYSIKDPQEMMSYSYTNLFVPINLSFNIKPRKDRESNFIGIFVQYNAFIKNVRTTYTGVTLDASGVPPVSQNSLTIGLKYRW